MQLLQGRQVGIQLIGVFIVIVLLLNKLEYCETMDHNDGSRTAVGDNANQPTAEEVTVKKALDGKTSPTAQENKQKITPTGEQLAAAAATAVKPNIPEQTNMAAAEQANKKTVSTDSQEPTANTGTQQAASSANPSSPSSASAFLHHPGESILNSNEEISDSLKAGFYFFVALSFSAVSFIVFKVYRLRLSRAERKYGVQGDRSTQELTPLPIAIEDGPSDDEDQTLFEVHRQNIRIL